MIDTESFEHDERFDRALARARGYLAPPTSPRRVWPVLGAASLFAVSSMIFATAAILAPSVTLTHIAPSAAAQTPTSLAGPSLAGVLN